LQLAKVQTEDVGYFKSTRPSNEPDESHKFPVDSPTTTLSRMASNTPSPDDLISFITAAANPPGHFSTISTISTTIHRSGQFFAIKGYPTPALIRCVITPSPARVTFNNFCGRRSTPDLRYIWTPARVWSETPDGTILDAADNPRQSLFIGHDMMTPWDDMQLLYFSGYALWNYFMAPYYFSSPEYPRIKANELSETYTHSSGAKWRVLDVEFPDGFDTHCKHQKFYYDDKGHLRRHDYHVEITKMGTANHYSYDEKMVSGILVPSLRRVVGNGKSFEEAMSGVLLVLQDVAVRMKSDEDEVAKL
jgi:hypothetical protein